MRFSRFTGFRFAQQFSVYSFPNFAGIHFAQQFSVKETHMSPRILQVLNIIGLIGVITVNYLANALPIGGRTTGELSAFYPNLFVPAGITFAIWGVIYLALIGFIIYQAKGLFGSKTGPGALQRIGIWFFVSCLGNAGWIIAWHNLQIELSLLIMLVILGSLIVIYNRQVKRVPDSTADRWLAQFPFQLYLGWISVATIANATALLVSYKVDFGIEVNQYLAAGLVLIAAGFGIAFLNRQKDWAYAAVI
ncbi:MAG: hypothetical protein AAGI38_20065, partial [Bacteroidota bacterium]